MNYDITYQMFVDRPFDLELTLGLDQGHRWRRDPDAPDWYTSVIDGAFIRIHQDEQDGPLEIDFPWEEMADKLRWRVIQKLRWQFRIDEDTGAIYGKLAARDPKMGELLKRFYGLRIMRVDLWECLLFFILSAHNHSQSHVATWPTANRIDEIASAFWEGESQPRGTRYPFPRPEEVGSPAGLDRLNELWRTIRPEPNDLVQRQSRGAAQPWLSGSEDMPRRIHEAAWFASVGGLDALSGMPTHDVVFLLDKLPGVGAKTAQCVALFGLGRLDAFPVDTHITRALLSLYGQDPFQPHAGYASQFLFMKGLTIQSEKESPEARSFSEWLRQRRKERDQSEQ